MNVETPGAPTTLRDDALETDLYLASKLRTAARLVPSAAHDVRQPLGNIHLQATLLRDALKNDGAADEPTRALREKCLRIIEEEIRKLSQSLDAVTEFLRVPREAIDEVDLRDLLLDLKPLLGPSCKRQQVTLTVRIPAEPVFVVATRDVLKQAVINLSVNALEAMPEGGTLDLTLDRADARAIVSVADSGPGVPSDLRDRIFHLHFTTKSGGSGIGLHVGRTIVESIGGRLRLAASGDRGARFEIDLPAVSRG